MTETIWRIDKAKHAATTKTGEGAKLSGGRWTSSGFGAIYCAQNLSLAILEILVHSPDASQRQTGRVRFRIRVEAALVKRVEIEQLPADFSSRTPHDITRTIGDDWLRRRDTPVLSVPSAIVPVERNYILNPEHADFKKLAWDSNEPISLDDRLWMIGA